VRELWVELGATMRMLRTRAGMSLRQAELASGRGRGTLSQIENGKARPGRDLVEWYDAAFGSDGLLQSIYAEARGAHGPQNSRPGDGAVEPLPGDELRVSHASLASGQLVEPGSLLTAGWLLCNAGSVPWVGRRLRRVGTHAGVRLIVSRPAVPVPDCLPGDAVTVQVEVEVPPIAGTFAAYWQLVDLYDRPCFPGPTPFAVVLTASS
jgi:transcriptional regulator with XRE-family HTH domain